MYDNLKKLANDIFRLMPEEDAERLRQYWLELIKRKHPEYFEQYPNLDLLQDPKSPVRSDLLE